MKFRLIYILLLFVSQSAAAQSSSVLTFSEYMAYVKSYHPLVRQADLLISESEAKLMKARGALDPKIEVQGDEKNFSSKNYFSKLDAGIKIPLGYGVEVKGGYSNNAGYYLDPESTTPEQGLYALGVKASLLRDLLTNERMAMIKAAGIYQDQAAVKQKLLVNDIVLEASNAYFLWLKSYLEQEVYKQFYANSEQRFKAVKKSFELGDKPAIDTLEARINVNKRSLQLEKAKLDLVKAGLKMTAYIWIGDTPADLSVSMIPDTDLTDKIDGVLAMAESSATVLSVHPKLIKLGLDSDVLELEQRLKRNNLLPRLDVQYNLLTQPVGNTEFINTDNYKLGVSMSMPLFYRKERAELNLVKYKMERVEYERSAVSTFLSNKIKASEAEIESYYEQSRIAKVLNQDQNILLDGEERKFNMGESSLFLVNSRESKLIDSQLKLVDLNYRLLFAKAQLFNLRGGR